MADRVQRGLVRLGPPGGTIKGPADRLTHGGGECRPPPGVLYLRQRWHSVAQMADRVQRGLVRLGPPGGTIKGPADRLTHGGGECRPPPGVLYRRQRWHSV